MRTWSTRNMTKETYTNVKRDLWKTSTYSFDEPEIRHISHTRRMYMLKKMHEWTCGVPEVQELRRLLRTASSHMIPVWHLSYFVDACCSVVISCRKLQRVALSWCALQCVATWCSSRIIPESHLLYFVKGCCSDEISCSELQCVAVSRSVLQCVAMWCSSCIIPVSHFSYYVEGCCSVLQCVAVCFNLLQCVAMCCNVLQCVAVCCSVLQCVAMCCSVMQCVMACCLMF